MAIKGTLGMDADGTTELDAWVEFPGKTFASNMGSATWVTILTV